MKDKSPIDQTKEDIEWLKKNIHTQDIDKVTKVLNRIGINSFYVAEQIADAHALMNASENDYKKALVDYQSQHINEGVGKSKVDAEAEYSGMRLEWKDAESIYKRLNLIYDSIQTVLETHRQRISYLKKEREQSNYQT